MMILETLRLALRSMTGNPSRTFLTMLGVMVGIASVIALMAVGEGQKQAQLLMYEKLGSNLLTVRTGWSERRGPNAELTLDIALELLQKCAHARAVSPSSGERSRVEYLRNNAQTPVTGALPEFFDIERYPLLMGREFTAEEVVAGARYAVLGFETWHQLFGDRDPIGETIKINAKSFTVIGVMDEKGALPYRNLDDQVVVPLTTFMRSVNREEGLERIIVQATRTEDASVLEEEIKAVLMARFPAFARDEDLFFIRNSAEQQEEREKAAGLISGFLLIVGGVALLIGGIGIMNIMLVTVSERTGEIGLRKAIGATPIQILMQFLMESLVLCLLSAAAGIGVGLYIIHALTVYSQGETAQLPAPILNPDAVGVSVAVSALIAIFFGLLPAINASRQDPIHALRTE